jgi:riboflavin kinase/FMN adenylyltransferase
MRVINDLRELDEQPAPSVVTIGNFDGVHLAHQTLLRRVVEVARPQGLQAAAITFEPHPIKILSPDHAPKLLTPLPRKVELIAATGIDLLVVLPFTRELARQSPLEFVRRALIDPLHASSVHVGPNFRFGYRQSGDTEVLEELGNQEGSSFEVTAFPAREFANCWQKDTSTRPIACSVDRFLPVALSLPAWA